MKVYIWLDDIRNPPVSQTYVGKTVTQDDWKIARSYEEFCDLVDRYSVDGIEHISFDHDLGEVEESRRYLDGSACASYLIARAYENAHSFPTFSVHSMNPVGAENIRSKMLQTYLIFRENFTW